MVFSTNIGKQLVHMNYISALISATQHFHESYQVTCHEMEFSSQHQTQCAESFSPENYLRFLLLKLKVSRFDYMRLLKVTRNSFQHKHWQAASTHELYLSTCLSNSAFS